MAVRCAVELVGGDRIQRVVDQRRLAGSGHAGDAGEQARGDVQVDVLQVVAAGAAQRAASSSGSACGASVGHLDAALAGQVVAGQRTRRLQDVVASVLAATISPPCTPAPGPMSTMWSAARIASSSCSTTITVLPRSRRRVRVPSRRSLSRWCRPMRRFVQHVHHADQAGADLRGQADALRFAAGQGVGLALQRQVVQADIDQEAQAFADFLDDLGGDFAAPAGQVRASRKNASALVDRQRPQSGKARSATKHVARGPVQARAAAVRAGAVADELGQFLAHRRRFGFPVAALQVRHDAFEGLCLRWVRPPDSVR